MTENYHMVPLDKEEIRAKVEARWRISLPQDDPIWVFVDVMDETNERLLIRGRHFMQQEIQSLLKESHKILETHQHLCLTQSKHALGKQLDRLVAQQLRPALEKTRQKIQECDVTHQNDLGHINNISRSCQHAAVAAYCTALVSIAITLWPLIRNLLA